MKLMAVPYTRIIKYYRNTDYKTPESRMTMKLSKKLDTLTEITIIITGKISE